MNDAEFQLSVTQLGLWSADQGQRASPVHTVAWRWLIRGSLDSKAFTAAVTILLDRHEALRAGFGTREGRPVRWVTPHVTVDVGNDDARHLPEVQREAMLSDIIARERRAGFDLSKPPLMRMRLIRVADDRHVVLLFVHRLVFDEISAEIFLRELFQCYDALVDGRDAELPDAPQYGEFADWQQAHLEGSQGEPVLDFWRGRFAGAPALLELFGGTPRPPTQRSVGGVLRFVIPRETVAAVRQVASARHSTLFMAYVAILQVALARYSDRADVVVGTSMANRQTTRLTNVVGSCANVVALRTDLSGEPTFGDLLDRVRDVILDASRHQGMPFERLVEERNPSHHPFFQIGCGLASREVAGVDSAYLTLEAGESLPPEYSTLDLSCAGLSHDDRIEVTLRYDTALFDETRMTQFADHLTRLWQQVASHPDLAVDRLEMLSDNEFALLAAPPDAVSTPRPVDVLRQHASVDPGLVALEDGDGAMTYAELMTAVEVRRDRLAASGIGSGAVVSAVDDVVVTTLAATDLGATVELTSGVVLTPESLTALSAVDLGLRRGERLVLAGSAHPDLFAALAAGATCCPAPGEPRLPDLPEFIARSGATAAWLPMRVPPTMARELAGLRLLITGCATPPLGPLGDRTVRVLSSSAVPLAAVATAADDTPRLRPAPGVRAYVLDSRLRPVPPGVCGELYLTAAHLTADAQLMPNPFAAGGFMARTGHLVRAVGDGSVAYLGAVAEVPLVDGARVASRLVEAAVAGHPLVRDVVVRPDERDFRTAYVAAAGSIELSELRAFLVDRLPQYALPTAVVAIDEVPLAADGTVDGECLRAMAGSTSPAAPATPDTALTRLLVSMWSELFDGRPVAVDDDFFHLGGQSLFAVRLLAKIKEILAVELPLSALFTASTPAALADEIVKRLSGPDEAEELAASVEQVLLLSDDEVRQRLGS
ncbi:condensation domain-containing protein [Amycolatopsis sp. cmx-11-12]|uniref:condensation domain-containing protein n=1 Tax=Amycolatopsis sp. cmx-11-12 TaxID=2785795 RepID=UPI0039175745